MEPKEFDFEFPRGDTCPFEFEITDSNGNFLNIDNNAQIYFTLKRNYNTQDVILQKKYTNEEITLKNGIATLILNHNDTAELKYGKYVYDIQFKSGDYVKTLIIGEITLTNESTWKINE